MAGAGQASSERVDWWQQQLTARIPTISIPERIGEWDYFTLRLRDRSVLCRIRPGGSLATREVVFDPAETVGAGIAIDRWTEGPTPDLLFVWTAPADEISTLRVVDVNTKKVVGKPVDKILQGTAAGPYVARYKDPNDVTSGYLALFENGVEKRVPLPEATQDFTFIGELGLVEDGDSRYLTAVRWHGNARSRQVLVADLKLPGTRADRPEFAAVELKMPPRTHELNIRDGYATFVSTDPGHDNGAVYRVRVGDLSDRGKWGAPLIPADADRTRRLMAVKLVGKGEHAALVATYNHLGVNRLEVFGLGGDRRQIIEPPDGNAGGDKTAAGVETYDDKDGRPTVRVGWRDINGTRVYEHRLGPGASAATEWGPSGEVAALRPQLTDIEQIYTPFTLATGRKVLSVIVRRRGSAQPAKRTYTTTYTHYWNSQEVYGDGIARFIAAMVASDAAVHCVITEPTLPGPGLAEPAEAVIAAQKMTNELGLTCAESSALYAASAGASTAALVLQMCPEEFGGGAALHNGYHNFGMEVDPRARYPICQVEAFGLHKDAAKYSPQYRLEREGYQGGARPRIVALSAMGDHRTPRESQTLPYIETARRMGARVLDLVSGADLGHLSQNGDALKVAGLDAQMLAATERNIVASAIAAIGALQKLPVLKLLRRRADRSRSPEPSASPQPDFKAKKGRVTESAVNMAAAGVSHPTARVVGHLPGKDFHKAKALGKAEGLGLG